MLSEDRSVLSRTSAAAPVMVSYGADPDQVAEIWAEAPDAPLVVVVHGGFWKQQYDRAHCRGLAAALAQLGATVVLLEYRRVGGGGGWPATFDDVRTGLRKIVQHHPAASRRVLVGHSAGGHLALWVAATEPTPLVDAVVGLAPIADLSAMARFFGAGENPVHDLLAGTPDGHPDRYDLADPLILPTPRADIHLLHGIADTVVPIEQSLSYSRRHVGTRVTELRCAHFELIDPRSDAFTAVRDAVTAELGGPASPQRRSRPW
ncbi:MAG: alpha/beta hydrolase [Actinomycetia bacterium]|nr:alpha/beta hydrolase [Actinomycetes bacterium]